MRLSLAQELRNVRIGPHGGTPQQISHRDHMASFLEDRIAQLEAVEERLCFGRLDLADARRLYIGRIGVSSDDRLLVDWRAPAAAPFYQATAVEPLDVVLRRHLSLRERHVVSIEDDVLDLEKLGATGRSELNGEGALLNAISAPRTGRMQDIVATIQAEQDRIIRSDARGVLVVQGGPGTGKTAVALQRAAYLLFTHRETIARSGVLLLGPNHGFLTYIANVLPALGETGAVMLTVGELFPKVSTALEDPPQVAAIKGDLRMVEVIRAAVLNWQRVPDEDQVFDIDGSEVVLPREVIRNARDSARSSRKPHNRARGAFTTKVLDHMARQLAMQTGEEYDQDTRADLFNELRHNVVVRRVVNWCWLGLTPQMLLKQLYTDQRALRAAAAHLGPEECSLLHRDTDVERWTISDIPLLDEAEELLGDDGRAEQRRKSDQRRVLADARRESKAVMQMYAGSDTFSSVTSDELADHFAGGGGRRDITDLAIDNRDWMFGHVVVDEAQEMTPMMWRLVARRCPTRSMTVVGDLAQTSAPVNGSWRDRLPERTVGKARIEELSVNYRTPEQIMDLAVEVLKRNGIEISAPRSVRRGDDPIDVLELTDGAIDDAITNATKVTTEGQVLVVCANAERVGTISVAEENSERVAVRTVRDAKGLEYDHVVIIDPDEILAASERGANDLYVAMTRATQRLTLVARLDSSLKLGQSLITP